MVQTSTNQCKYKLTPFTSILCCLHCLHFYTACCMEKIWTKMYIYTRVHINLYMYFEHKITCPDTNYLRSIDSKFVLFTTESIFTVEHNVWHSERIKNTFAEWMLIKLFLFSLFFNLRMCRRENIFLYNGKLNNNCDWHIS